MRRWMGKSLASGTIELPVGVEVFDLHLPATPMRVGKASRGLYKCEMPDWNGGTANCERGIRISQFRLPGYQSTHRTTQRRSRARTGLRLLGTPISG